MSDPYNGYWMMQGRISADHYRVFKQRKGKKDIGSCVRSVMLAADRRPWMIPHGVVVRLNGTATTGEPRWSKYLNLWIYRGRVRKHDSFGKLEFIFGARFTNTPSTTNSQQEQSVLALQGRLLSQTNKDTGSLS